MISGIRVLRPRSLVRRWERRDTTSIRGRIPPPVATSSAAPFTEPGHREMLLDLFESGTGDPLRWSEARVERALSVMSYFGDRFPLEVALDAPDLLRAFIPFAHAQSGIRDELTSRTLGAIDELRSNYKRNVLKNADYWWLDDAG